MRERRQTAHACFLTKKKVGLFLILPPVVFPYLLCSRKKITTVCQHRRALPANVVDSDARPGRINVSPPEDVFRLFCKKHAERSQACRQGLQILDTRGDQCARKRDQISEVSAPSAPRRQRSALQLSGGSELNCPYKKISYTRNRSF